MTKTQVEVTPSLRPRRRWSKAEKERIVAAAMEPGAVVSAVAREAGIQASQLFRWRQQLHGSPGPASLALEVTTDAASIAHCPLHCRRVSSRSSSRLECGCGSAVLWILRLCWRSCRLWRTAADDDDPIASEAKTDRLCNTQRRHAQRSSWFRGRRLRLSEEDHARDDGVRNALQTGWLPSVYGLTGAIMGVAPVNTAVETLPVPWIRFFSV